MNTKFIQRSSRISSEDKKIKLKKGFGTKIVFLSDSSLIQEVMIRATFVVQRSKASLCYCRQKSEKNKDLTLVRSPNLKFIMTKEKWVSLSGRATAEPVDQIFLWKMQKVCKLELGMVQPEPLCWEKAALKPVSLSFCSSASTPPL